MTTSGNEDRMAQSERRIQQLQDASMNFYSWSGQVGNRLYALEAGVGQLSGQMAILQQDVAQLKVDMKQVHRFMVKIAAKLDVDLGDDPEDGDT